MRQRFYAVFLAVSALALVMGCSTLGDDKFLLKQLDDPAKAAALTNQGIQDYNNYLIDQGAYSKAASIREYFVVALRYDPTNGKAKQYLDKVDNFRTSLARSKLQTANKILARPKRSEDDNFAMIVALQSAVAIDPSNDSANKLLKDNASVQSNLLDTYLGRSKDAMSKAGDPKASDASREALLVKAYDAAAKAVIIAPSNQAAASQKAAVKAELQKAFAKHIANVSSLAGKAKFDDAKSELSRASSLNAKLGRENTADVTTGTYTLYFQWAKYLASKGNPDADDKLDVAIAAKKTDEALALRKKLAAKAAAGNQNAAFDAALPEIDKYIASGDMLSAYKRLTSAAKLTNDKSRQNALDDRRDKINASLSDIYDKGVASYRAENFKDAIDQLSVVVGIDAEYEQASDYLDKAKEKQKLLDQYSD